METEITEYGKKIYNAYLKSLGIAGDRPYKYRKNFDKFDQEDKGTLIKLETFFRRYDHIDIDMFFIAPYKLWSDVTYYPLEFFSKRKALTCYLNYKKYLLTLSPDDEYHIVNVVKGFYFIKDFCLDNSISINNYLEHKDGIYSFLNHLQRGDISIYNIFVFENFKSIFRDKVDKELKEVLFGSLYKDYDILYRKYVHSNKCSEISKKCLKKIP